MFSVIGLVPGVLVGYGIGHVVGRKLKKKPTSQDYNKDKQYLLRLASWIIFLKVKVKSKTPIADFTRILEKAMDEFRPALVMQMYNEEVGKKLAKLVHFLKTTPCHTCLLNSILEVQFNIKSKLNPQLLASKLRRFIIPTYHILKQYFPTLEVVQKAERLLTKPAVREILESQRCVSDQLGISLLTKTTLSENLLLSQLMMLEDYDKSYHQKAFSKIAKGKPASLPDDSSEPPHVKLSYKQKKCFGVLMELYPCLPIECQPSIEDSIEPSEPSQYVPILERRMSLPSFSRSCSLLTLNELTLGLMYPPKIFEGYTNDLLDSDISDEEDSELSIQLKEPKEVKHHDSIFEEAQISKLEDKKAHPFIESFDHLLAIEAEPTGGVDWKETVNTTETKIYTKTPKDSPLCMVKAFCEIPYPQEIVFKAIWDTDLRRQWDAVFNEFKLIDSHEFDDSLYYMIKTPFGITKRDWIQRRTHLLDYPSSGNIIAHFISIDHPDVPPVKGVIRASTIVSGYIFRARGPDSCTLTIISQNDIKGLIPKMIVNRVASKAPADWVKSLYKGCELAKSIGS